MTLLKKTFKSRSFCSIPISVMVLFEIHQRFKGHFLNKLRVSFNVKHVKQKPLQVCITCKVARFLEFYIFAGYKNINMFLVILLTISTFTEYYTVLLFLKRYFIENYLTQSCLILKTTTPKQLSSNGHNKVLDKLK